MKIFYVTRRHAFLLFMFCLTCLSIWVLFVKPMLSSSDYKADSVGLRVSMLLEAPVNLHLVMAEGDTAWYVRVDE